MKTHLLLPTIIEGFWKNSPTSHSFVARGLPEQQIDEIFCSLIPLLFLHGRPLGLVREVILKGN
jgi:hypothetical protein